jgi:hypothetical protein
VIQEVVKVAAPVVCLGLASWLIFDGQENLSKARAAHGQASTSLATNLGAQSAYSRIHSSSPIVARPESQLEGSTFLDGIRKHAALCDVSILKWSTTEEAFKEPELSGLKRVSSHVSIVGRYANLFKFLDAMSDSPRFYTLSDVRWARHEQGNRLDVSITRYLEPDAEKKS